MIGKLLRSCIQRISIGFILGFMVISTPSFAGFLDEIAGLEHRAGLFDIYIDKSKGRVLAALPKASETGVSGRYLLASYLTAGLGSNPMGLDRSAPTQAEIIHFRLAGGKIYAVVENHDYRASADNPNEQMSVENSFAKSIVWSGDVIAQDTDSGRILIDLSSYLVRDPVRVAARLAGRKQGSFKLAKDRSFVETGAAFMFPLNAEFDATITFKGTKPGYEVRTTTPVPEAVTLIAHTSFMKLPDDDYKSRQYDDRAGLLLSSHVDMSAPLNGDTIVRLAERFRLEKNDQGQVIKPIVFYVDNGAPEPIRSALVEGASWWASAFEKAGFSGGYRVEILPDDVHPLDARYNVINWVHRSTRGWSYGASIVDPRTGEILRGVVLLGSLRVRQDIKIFEALAGTAKTGTGADDDPVELALDRVRQLSAHEVGHTLGFAHNMGASSQFGRASVMDYPAPYVKIKGEKSLDFSETYAVGIGAWDDFTVDFLYGDYGVEVDNIAQAEKIRAADAKGLRYVKDQDSRSVGTMHPHGAVWDNGTDPIAELQSVMAVRSIALDRFGEANLRRGENHMALQTKIVPLYLYHRYQLAAAAKMLGGVDFMYRHQGDGRPMPTLVERGQQESALNEILNTVQPEALAINEDIIMQLSPLSRGDGDPQFNREIFKGSAGPMFDPITAAGVASKMAFDALLHPARATRLAIQGGHAGHFGLSFVLKKIEDRVMQNRQLRGDKLLQLAFAAQSAFVEKLIDLHSHAETPPQVRATIGESLSRVKKMALKLKAGQIHYGRGLADRIDVALRRGNTPAVKDPATVKIPPGSPIGSGAVMGTQQETYNSEDCWFCDLQHN